MVSNFSFELMNFGERLHANFDLLSQIIDLKNSYILHLNKEMEQQKLDSLQLNSKIEEILVEISNEKAFSCGLTRHSAKGNGPDEAEGAEVEARNQIPQFVQRVVGVQNQRILEFD